MRPGLDYRFPEWCRTNIPGRGPAAVHAWLESRGVVISREAVRKLLAGRPRDIRIATWRQICDATGCALSEFFDYVPAMREPREPLRHPRAVKRRPAIKPTRFADRRPSLPLD